MASPTDCNATPEFPLPPELTDCLISQGLQALPEAVRVLINTAMRIERERHLGAGPFERSEEWQGHANGYKAKTVATRLGKIEFAVPQVREAGARSKCEKAGSILKVWRKASGVSER